ncbi:glycosyltransferase family 4 protein [Candidatus Falkowbacteria bacterium]|nr:glycosyltransferase family 4 protein [Candidatus Falkowbacteria bacterium]
MNTKIAQVVCVYPPYRGGIGTMSYNHSVALAKLGYEVHVFTLPYGDEPEYSLQEGVHVHRMFPLATFGNAGVCPQITKLVADFDIVHLHYPFYGVAEFLIAAQLAYPKWKLVTTYHMDVKGSFALSPFFALHAKFLLPKLIKRSDAVIVTSNDYAAHSKIKKQFYSIPNKFHEIPPEVNTQHFYPRERSENHVPTILFVGGLDKAHYFKGVDFLITSFSLMHKSFKENQPRLVIVGSGDLQKKYELHAKNIGVAEHVVFAGNVSNDDLPAQYSNADVTILPSIDSSEAFGIVLIESLASGTPVLASRLPGVRTVAPAPFGKVFGVKNEGECAALMREALTTNWKASVTNDCVDFAQKNYSSEVVVAKLIEVYNGIK